ncbi:hypothetical protein KJR66_27605, partial [Klebsiella pneumoniae]
MSNASQSLQQWSSGRANALSFRADRERCGRTQNSFIFSFLFIFHEVAMNIAAALGVCHFLVYKTTTPECWRRRLRMILAKKRPFPGKGHARMTLWVQRLHINYKIASAFTPERGCTTELHQKYIKITSLLRQIAGVQQN